MGTESRKHHHHHHGRPPWHAVALVALLMTMAVMHLPSTTDLDDRVAADDLFTHRLFPDYMSVTMLLAVRTASAIYIFGLSLHSLHVAHQPGQATTVVVPYLPQSKLQRGHALVLRGFYCQAPFTVWAWNLLGLSFAVNAYLTYATMQQQQQQPQDAPPMWLLRAGIVLFETAAPLTLLVSAVVKYALWPRALQGGAGKKGDDDPTRVLKSFRALSYHNVNVALAMAEVSLWGGIPVRLGDLSLSVLFGCCYILFAWTMRNWWNPAAGPQFLYFFMDTSLGYATTMALAALCAVLVTFYGLFCSLQTTLEYLGGSSALAHILSWFMVCALVVRVRD